jgi:hypothetical protein
MNPNNYNLLSDEDYGLQDVTLYSLVDRYQNNFIAEIHVTDISLIL